MLLKAVAFFAVFAKFLVPTECERIEPRIIGGELCKIERIPYIALLSYVSLNTTTNETSANMCGGSVLTASWVLTAGHCVCVRDAKTIQMTAMVGSTYYDPKARWYHADKFVPHPAWNSKIFDNDIALVHLNESIKKTVIFPEFVKTKLESDECTKGFIAGWGLVGTSSTSRPSPFLKCANITLYTKKEYTIFGNSWPLPRTKLYQIITDDEVSPYYGDSGGPLTCDGKLIGVVSVGAKQLIKGYLTFFTKIESYFKFIASHTGLKLPPWEPTDPEYLVHTTTTTEYAKKSDPSHHNLTENSVSNYNSLPSPTMILLLLVLPFILKQKCY